MSCAEVQPALAQLRNTLNAIPADIQEKNLTAMLDHVIAWSDALKTLRDKRGD